MDKREQYLRGLATTTPERKLTQNSMGEIHRKVFEAIANPDDWRAPINFVHSLDSPLTTNSIVDAIQFMTGTEPLILIINANGRTVRIISEGYRLGPAGA